MGPSAGGTMWQTARVPRAHGQRPVTIFHGYTVPEIILKRTNSYWLWRPSRLLLDGYQDPFPRGKATVMW